MNVNNTRTDSEQVHCIK